RRPSTTSPPPGLTKRPIAALWAWHRGEHMAIEGRGDSALGKIKYGMVGGGEGAFIGAVHRLAARMDDHYELVAGALSSSPEKAIRSAKALGIAADRSYGDYETMASAE